MLGALNKTFQMIFNCCAEYYVETEQLCVIYNKDRYAATSRYARLNPAWPGTNWPNQLQKGANCTTIGKFSILRPAQIIVLT